jgi:hypothetical protein
MHVTPAAALVLSLTAALAATPAPAVLEAGPVGVTLGPGQAVAPAPTGEASTRDLERLQDDLENLEDLLDTLEPNDSQADAFRARAQPLQEDVVYLKVKVRRHQESGAPGIGLSAEEVDRVRRGAFDLREDIERAFGGGGSARRALSLPTGAEFTVRLGQTLSSKAARLEDRFEATVDVPVRTESGQVLPAGTTLRGIVRSVDRAERPSKPGRLELDFYALYLGPLRFDVRARVVQIGPHEKEGASKGKKAGIGSVLGGVLGLILSGGTGAVVGIVTGGAGAVLGTKGEEVVLPEGTRLTVRLDRPLDIPAGPP